jgi:hypothetical protein
MVTKLANGRYEADLKEHGANRGLFGTRTVRAKLSSDKLARHLFEGLNNYDRGRLVHFCQTSGDPVMEHLLEMAVHQDDMKVYEDDDEAGGDGERPEYHAHAANAIKEICLSDLSPKEKLKKIKTLLGIMDDGQDDDGQADDQAGDDEADVEEEDDAAGDGRADRAGADRGYGARGGSHADDKGGDRGFGGAADARESLDATLAWLQTDQTGIYAPPMPRQRHTRPVRESRGRKADPLAHVPQDLDGQLHFLTEPTVY